MDDWIVPKCDNVLFEGDEDVSAFLLGDGALRRSGTLGLLVPLLEKFGDVGLPVSTSADGHLFRVRWMGKEFIG